MKNLLDVLLSAWNERATLGDAAKQKALAEFLPAALEIQETPPNPLARWLGWSLIVLFLLTLLWACFGKVDVVASAEGKIIPSARIKIIQPLSKGVVKNIHVKEGQYVKQGDLLIELDRTLTGADQTRMEKELQTAGFELIGAETYRDLLVGLNATKPQAVKQVSAPTSQDQLKLLVANAWAKQNAAQPIALLNHSAQNPTEVLLHSQRVWQQWQQFLAQLGSLTSSLQKAEAEKLYSAETVKKLEQTLPMATKRAQAMESLYKRSLASEYQYMELEQGRIENVQNLAAEQQRQQQLSAAIREVQQQINALKADALNKTLTEISNNTQKVASLREELIKATDVNAKQMLTAPVTGYVQELSVNTIGGVVTDAQKLMTIVPEEEELEVEVLLGNQDIGFVKTNMPAEIKIHTFPFTKYGLIDATVTTLSDDAIMHEKLGLVFSMHLKMHKNTIQVGNKNVKLTPGMAVTTEVKTDKRRVIEYFLDPVLRYKQESIRER